MRWTVPTDSAVAKKARRIAEELGISAVKERDKILNVLAGPGNAANGNPTLHRLAKHEDAAWLEIVGLAAQLNAVLTLFLEGDPTE